MSLHDKKNTSHYSEIILRLQTVWKSKKKIKIAEFYCRTIEIIELVSKTYKQG